MTLMPMPDGISLAEWERVLTAIEECYAPGTREVYASHWKKWRLWCSAHGVPDLPASAEDLAAYLAERAISHAMNTVRTVAAAISYYHTRSGQPSPARHEGVQRTLAGLARQYPTPPGQVSPIRIRELIMIETVAAIPRPIRRGMETAEQAELRAATDLAMVGLMRDCLLRRSEAASLTWDHLDSIEDGQGVLYIARSKTDQVGAGAYGHVSAQTMRWVRQVRELAPDREHVLGISPHQIARRIVSAANAAGLQGRYGGHSPRIGMAQDLAIAGIELPALMNAGRWKSPQMPALYTRKLKAKNNAVADWYAMRGG